LGSNNQLDLEEIKKLYDDTFKELTVFLETGKTFKEIASVEEFKVEVKKFWERSGVWQSAWENSIYPEIELNRDFEKIRLNAKRLLFDQQ
jgi:hypothetical protein